MSRSAFISASGDPFILLLLHKLFKERWYDEVNTLWIDINNHCGIPLEVIKELMGRLVDDPKVRLIYHPTGIGNGVPITEMSLISKDDHVFLLEDDFYIFTPGVVDGYFKKIESGEVDVVGSPRYSYGEVADAAKRKYNLDYSGAGDKGFGWWPAGFYCKREDLLKTDLDFGSKAYRKDEYFKELDHTFSEDCFTDTFTWASIQLRYQGLKSLDIPQYHADPFEIENKDKGEMNWVGEKPTYIHAGSLSAGWGGYLSGQVPDLSNENAIREIETRVAWWGIAADIVEGFDDFKREYRAGIEQLIVNGKLDRDRINKKTTLYKDLMGNYETRTYI